jgi:hypothetical protein
MNLNLVLTAVVVLALGSTLCFPQNGTIDNGKRPVSLPTVLDGTYEFISQDTWIVKPVTEHTRKISPDWSGQWHFHDGLFASVMMQKGRTKFLECEDRDLGFEAFAGKYSLRSRTLFMEQSISLAPFYEGRTVTMSYTKRGSVLELTHTLKPHVEDEREGKVVIILKKVR